MGVAEPVAWGVTLHTAELNGITMRWADTAKTAADKAKPIILMMHGWPESWFSYRHQLKAVGATGFRGIAPDMRGYGGTSAPEHAADYTCHTLAADMIALLTHLGASNCALVGHDHGANTGWTLALLHPEVFCMYLAMSVPYNMRRAEATTPPIENFRKIFGDEREPESDPGFFYMLHHQLPEATQQYAENARSVLTLMYGDGSSTGSPEVTSDRMYVGGSARGMWSRSPQPRGLAPWISEAELDYVVAEFERAGWNGGLNWYRVMDINWHATPHLANAVVKQPSLFIAGTNDGVVKMSGGVDAIKASLAASCAQGEEPVFVEGAGHWIQQEAAALVNQKMLGFVEKHKGLLKTPSISKL